MNGDETDFGVNFADGRIKGYGLSLHGSDKTFFIMYVRGDTDYGVNDFVDNGDGTITDSATGLMWLQDDSGAFGAGSYGDGSLNWQQALDWCEDKSYAGYSDWRLPDIKELATLYLPDTINQDGYFLTDTIKISDCCMWSSYDTMGGALAFSFKSGKRPAAYLADTYQLRALAVRGTMKKGAVDKKTTSFGGSRKVKP